MGEKIQLDPRKIIGEILIDSPTFIVEFVAKMCRIPYNQLHINIDGYRNDVIKLINESEFPEIEYPSVDSNELDLKKIIRFVSPFLTTEDWFCDSILDSLFHIMTFSISMGDLPFINKDNLIIGPKTNETPLALNELLVFRIANHYKYCFDRNTSLHEINFFVEKILSRKISNLRTSLLHTINSLSDTDMIKIYFTTSNIKPVSTGENVDEFNFPERKEQRAEFDQMYFEASLANMFNPKKTLIRIKPKTSYEAIIYAAIKHNINIIGSSDPLKEIDNLRRSTYIPYCRSLAEKYAINSKFFYLNRTWCEQLSNSNIYTVEQLRTFAAEEGFECTNKLSFNELNSYLKSTKTMINVYFGKNPNCKETKTAITLTPINEINNEEILCFGIEKKSELIYISLDELIDFFKTMKMYVDPFKNLPIDERVVRKLKMFCNSATGELSYKTRILYNEMVEMDKIKKFIDTKVMDLKIKISKADPETKENVDFFFQKCMEMGLYMRGWKINPNVEYPLLSQDTVVDETLETEPSPGIDISIYGENFKYTVGQKIIDNSVRCLDESIEILKELPIGISNDIRSLQSVKFTDNGIPVEIFGFLIKGAYTYQNETLLESMRMIYRGFENNESCRRSNSGWVLFSACWYRLIFGFNVPFRIDKIQTTR